MGCDINIFKFKPPVYLFSGIEKAATSFVTAVI